MSTLIEQAEAQRVQARDKRVAARELSNLDAPTAEQEKQFDALISEADDLDASAEALEVRAEKQRKNDASIAGYSKPKGSRTPPGGGTAEVTDAAKDDPMRGFRSEQDYMQAVIAAGRTGRVDERLAPLAVVGSDEHSGHDSESAGWLVPEAMSPNVRMLQPENDPIGSRVTQIPMGAPIVKLAARVDKDHSDSVSGGLRVYRRAEAHEVNSSKMKFDGIKLEANPLMGVAFSTRELLSDSPQSFAAMLVNGFRSEIASRKLRERFNGLGAGEFLGIHNSDAMITVDAESGQGADTIVGLNIVNMRARCYGYENAVWTANHDTLPQLMAAHIAGTNGDVFLFAPGNGTDKPDTLLGRPIFFTEYAETLGDAGDLVLGNWAEYLEGTLEGEGQEASIHVRFVAHENALKVWMRNDGAPAWNTVLTPKNSAVTLSPFVRLSASRA